MVVAKALFHWHVCDDRGLLELDSPLLLILAYQAAEVVTSPDEVYGARSAGLGCIRIRLFRFGVIEEDLVCEMQRRVLQESAGKQKMIQLAHLSHKLPASKAMPPDSNEQMCVLCRCPVHSPVHCWLQALHRNRVIVQVVGPLEVFDDGFELVMSGDDRLGIESSYSLVREQDGLLS